MPAPSKGSRRTIVVATVVLVCLLGVWVRGNASDIRQARRLAAALDVGAGAARLVHEVQRERDLSAYFVASGRKLDYGSMVAQRVWVNQASRAYELQAGRLAPRLDEYDQRLGASITEAGRRLDGLRRFRGEQIDPKDQKVGTAETLRWYGTTVEALLGVVTEVSRVGEGSALSQDLQAAVALARYKEAVAQERSYLYATYAAGGFTAGKADPQSPAGVARAEASAMNVRALPFRGFTSILNNVASWRARFTAVAGGEWDDRLTRALDGEGEGEAARADKFSAQVSKDPTAISRADHKVIRSWFFSMNSYVDALRRLENQLLSDITARASAARDGANIW